jgi:hypothetical protein
MKKIISKIYSIFSYCGQLFRLIISLRDFISANSRYSYYKNTDRIKPIWKIYWENLRWIIKFNEINIAYFTYGFDEKSFSWSQQLRYLDAKSYVKLIHTKNKLTSMASHAPVLNDKYLFTLFVEGVNKIYGENIAVPKFLGFCNIDGVINAKWDGVKGWKEIDNIDAFCKPIIGFGGRDSFLIQIADGIMKIDGQTVGPNEVMNLFLKDSVWILQERIKQYPVLNQLYDKSVNSIRLVTYKSGNKFKVFTALLRTGKNGCTVDNWQKGGVLVDVDVDSGRLGEYGIIRGDRNLVRHPDTGVKFNSITIPHFSTLKKQALLLHTNLFNLKAVGWDVAIGEDGVVFIEGNAQWGIGMLQIIKGGLREDIHKIFGETSSQDYSVFRNT